MNGINYILAVKPTFLSILIVVLMIAPVFGQQADPQELAAKVKAYKQDIRGPYKDLRWHCADGSVRAPRDPCPEEIGPGVQHARYKDEVVRLGKDQHLFLGQILAATNAGEFWDAPNNHSRLKQYQLGKYLESVDDGWIMRKAQYYRGAVQSEDEAAWGRAFFTGLLEDSTLLAQDFFILRQAMKAVPHGGDDNLSQKMRSLSKILSDEYLPFMDLRVKIHGQPEAGDIAKVRAFKQKHAASLSRELLAKFDELLLTMSNFYQPIDLKKQFDRMGEVKKGPLAGMVGAKINAILQGETTDERIKESAELLLEIRKQLPLEKKALARLQLLDLSIQLEEWLFKNALLWEPESLHEGLDKICHLAMASAGAGYLELWEWDELLGALAQSDKKVLTLDELNLVLESARSAVEWSAAMIKAHYQEVVSSYAAFEPLAHGFIDDQVRGSVALQLGSTVGLLGNYMARETKLSNKVMGLPNQSSIRGLNPGYALGELVVVGGSSEDIEVRPDKIYLFERSPADLKPVAGIATVAEGNLVSHVQLLARNLGIPNAALSDENLRQLQKFDGQLVFYAVSNKGNVIMKPANSMNAEEQALFAKKERREERIEVPVAKIRLDQKNILNMNTVDADDSGILCGPKAANLGELKKLFPDKVVEGLVIPFGIFRDHMDLEMPGQNTTYWNFLKAMYEKAEAMRSQQIPEGEIENFQLRELEILRAAIKKIPLKPGFLKEIESEFQSVFGRPLGEVPVFLRSDTNMEDLKEFTGAGLNLTLFNVVEREKILNGIKDVWASPYTERSFKWRQRYLLNPENVYPSILVIPSVDVDCSGVLITKGINAGGVQDLTVAFSRGAGGAVEGQAAETYLINQKAGYRLLAPAREPFYNRLPESGGTVKKAAVFNTPVLNATQLAELREMALEIRRRIAGENTPGNNGAHDVELGFKDNKLWLFQIRPFVENKKALSSAYLASITPETDGTKNIQLSSPMQ